MDVTVSLPENIQTTLTAFVNDAQKAFGDNLCSVVLYGSGAEGRLRATSDINLMLVLKEFKKEQVDGLREPFRIAHAAIRLGVMFILQSEIDVAAYAFAMKFSDIVARHRVLWGTDLLNSISISRSAMISQVKQVLVNLLMRMRERYVLVSLREEQLARIVADFSGPLRASAAILLRLEGHDTVPPKEAFQQVVQVLAIPGADEMIKNISKVREQGILDPGVGPVLLFNIMELVKKMHDRVSKLL